MPNVENHLIELLPRKDRQRLLAGCERIDLVFGEVLCESGEPMRHVYFPTQGFISMMTMIDGGPALEVGMAGREGMLGVQVMLGVTTAPWRAAVQGPGASWRLSTPAFRKQLALSAPLRQLLNNYLYVRMTQLAALSACLHFHMIGPRLARWLLMSHDRMHDDSFRVTHELLAYMLGVRRVGITAAAGAFQRRGLIQYRRGHVTILDRPGLEAEACNCYSNDLRAYMTVLA